MLTTLLLLFIIGGAGTIGRYLVSGWVQAAAGPEFPWGTLAVNLVGAFLFGVVYALSVERNLIGPGARLLILTGFMGAFTTFSTLAFETTEMLRDAEWLAAAFNYLGQGVAGITAVLLGMAVGRIF